MKKIILSMIVAAGLVACGGGDDKTKEGDAKPDAEKKETPPADDKSNNPVYQKGLAVVAEPKNLCLTCHKIDEKVTGPAYRDVANKYEDTEANVKMLAGKIKNGGVGVWGDVPMPANAVISEEDAVAAIKYILLLKK
jgi:cytochrome c